MSARFRSVISLAAFAGLSQRHRLHAKGNDALLVTRYDGASQHCVAPLSPQG